MNKKKGVSIHEYLVVIIMLLVACILTYVVPAGAYTREEVNGVTKVIAEQFSFIEQTPVSPMHLFNYMYHSFVKQAALIFTMFFIAGGVQMIIDTDAIHAVMKVLVTKFSKAPRVTIVVMMIAFGIMGVPIQMNYFIPFSGVVLMLCLMMGYDALTAAAIIITSSSFGSTCGMLNISTTAIGNKLADLPIYHGMGFRWICVHGDYHNMADYPLCGESQKGSVKKYYGWNGDSDSDGGSGITPEFYRKIHVVRGCTGGRCCCSDYRMFEV